MAKKTEKQRVLVVIGHGRETSLCHSLTGEILSELKGSGAEVRTHDLLADGFDPVLTLGPDEEQATACDPAEEPLVARYQEDVRWADVYVIVHPVWWFAPPANLKGWVDRVFVDGVALEQKPDGTPSGTLGGRRAVLVQTFNAPKAIDRTLFGGISQSFWKRAVFLSVGIMRVKTFAIYGANKLTDAKYAKHVARLRKLVGSVVS